MQPHCNNINLLCTGNNAVETQRTETSAIMHIKKGCFYRSHLFISIKQVDGLKVTNSFGIVKR